MNIQIGTTPDSWGIWFASDSKQMPWKRFLNEVAQAGYTWTESGPYGYMSTDASKLRSELEMRGIRIAGGAMMANLEQPSLWPELEREFLGTGELLAALEAQFFGSD